MLYFDRFAGHLDPEDPRTVVTGAAGCVWPTIPAHRYVLGGPNATGVLTVLRTQGVLFEKNSPGDAHDDCQYLMISGPIPIVFGIAWKRWVPATAGYKWEIGLSVSSPCGIIEWEIFRDPETCNRDLTLPSGVCPGVPSAGATGDGTVWLQVEWDQPATTRWPPPS